jgi:hypothetical protein
VAGEAGAEAIECAQRQQLSLDVHSASRVPEPVPEVLRAVGGSDPLWAVEHRIGLDERGSEAIERARQKLTSRPCEDLEKRAERLDALVRTFPDSRVEAAQRADELTRLRKDRDQAHERVGEQRARLDKLGPLSRVFRRHDRESTEQALANWTERAEVLGERVWDLGHRVDADRLARAAWLDEHGDELAELAAAKVELHDRDTKARERRINDIRRDPPEWVTERLGPRPDDPNARTHWDRAAAHLDDYRYAFGQPPGDELPRSGDYRQRHAWEQVHDAAAKALDMHPERPVVHRPPRQLHRDIGLDPGR